MSYAAPTGNAVNFQKTGVAYSAPSGNSVYFQWIPDVPTVIINCSSVALFKAGSQYSISTGSVADFPNHVRTFSLQAGTTCYFKTDQRHFVLSSSTSTNFICGASIYFAAGTSLSVESIAAFKSVASVAANSNIAFNFSATNTQSFSSTARSRFYPGRGAIIGLALRSIAGTVFSPRSATSSVAAFSGQAGTNLDLRSTAIKDSYFYSATGTVVSGKTNALVGSSALSMCESSVMFSGLLSRQASIGASAATTAVFYSSYDYSPIYHYPEDADVAFVMTKTNQVTVLNG